MLDRDTVPFSPEQLIYASLIKETLAIALVAIEVGFNQLALPGTEIHIFGRVQTT